jgi:hypothetical protein
VTIHVIEGRDTDLDEWNRYASSHERSTVYHLSPWARIFGDALGYRSWLLMAKNDAGATCGILPVYLVRGLFGRRLVAVPFRDRGGPVFDTPDALTALLRHTGELARRENAGVVLKSLEPFPDDAAASGLARRDHWVHSRMPIADLTRDALWERIGNKNRNMVRQAQKSGLNAVRATKEPRAAERWHALHVATQHRLGVPPFPLRFFELMLDALSPSASIEVIEIQSSEGPCAATILFFHRDTCIYGYSASTAAGQRLRANDLLLFEAIALAAERKVAWFDFGSDSPSQESLLFFKSKWGAEQNVIPMYCSPEVALTDSADAKYELARMMFRAMPPALSSWIGSRVVRFFG